MAPRPTGSTLCLWASLPQVGTPQQSNPLVSKAAGHSSPSGKPTGREEEQRSQRAREGSMDRRTPWAEPELHIHKRTQTCPLGNWGSRQETNGKFWNIINVMGVLRLHRVQFAEVTFQSWLFISPRGRLNRDNGKLLCGPGGDLSRTQSLWLCLRKRRYPDI